MYSIIISKYDLILEGSPYRTLLQLVTKVGALMAAMVTKAPTLLYSYLIGNHEIHTF